MATLEDLPTIAHESERKSSYDEKYEKASIEEKNDVYSVNGSFHADVWEDNAGTDTNGKERPIGQHFVKRLSM